MTKKEFKKWKKRMYHLRTWEEKWQLTHQRRWEDNSPCWEDKCDCEEKKVNKVGFHLGS